MTDADLTALKKDTLFERYQAERDLAAHRVILERVARQLSSLGSKLVGATREELRDFLPLPTNDELIRMIGDHVEARQRLNEVNRACRDLNLPVQHPPT